MKIRPLGIETGGQTDVTKLTVAFRFFAKAHKNYLIVYFVMGFDKIRGVTLTPHSILMSWSRKSRAIPLLPLWAIRPVKSLSACKRKTVPLQAWSGPEGSKKLRFPDFMTTAQDGSKVVSLTHRPPLPP